MADYAIVGLALDSFGGTSYDGFARKTDPFGNTLWTHRYRSTGSEAFHDGIQLRDSSLVFVGYVNRLYGMPWIVRTTSTGDTIWTRIYDNYNMTSALAVRQGPDDSLYIVGSMRMNGPAIFLMKIGLSGEIGSFSFFSQGLLFPSHVTDLYVNSDGSCVLVGDVIDWLEDRQSLLIIKTNCLGSCQWTRVYSDGAHTLAAESIHKTETGEYLIGGDYDTAFLLLKVDEQGDTLWSRTYQYEYLGYHAYFGEYISDNKYLVSTTSHGGLLDFAVLMEINLPDGLVWTKNYIVVGQDYLGGDVHQTSDGGLIWRCGF